MIYLRSVLLFKTSKRKALSRIICLLAFFVVLYQVFGESKDFKNYEIFFENARFSGIEYLFTQRFEPLFSFLGWGISSLLQNNFVVYGVLVFFSLWIKSIALIPFIPSWRILLLIAVFYGTRFFPLHELTQIRAAISCSFLLLATSYSLRNQGKKTIIAGLCAVGFHMSSVIFIPFIMYFKKWKKSNMLFFCLIIFLGILLVKNILISFLGEHITIVSIYTRKGPDGFGGTINPFNLSVLLDLVMIFCGLFFWKDSSKETRHLLFLQVLGLFIYWGFWDFLLFANRWRQMITVLWLLYLPQMIYKKGIVAYIFIGLILLNLVFYSKMYFFSEYMIF